MQRSAFSQLPKPHELFTTAPIRTPSPQQHSRSRNRSSGGSSTGSPQPNLLVDSSDDNDDLSAPRFREMRSARRSLSPAADDPAGLLVPMHNWHDSTGQRVASPYPETEEEHESGLLLRATRNGLRIGEGSRRGWMTWLHDGKLGKWLWNSQKGWVVYAVALLVLYSVASLILLIMNRFILWTGVYKFGYPLTTTFIELAFTQFFLWGSASITRSFSRALHALGLGCMVAPRPKPGKGKHRAELRGLRDFASRAWQKREGGIFEFKFVEAKMIAPLAIIYSGKIMLCNLSFAFTQLQIYQVSRVPTLLVCLIFTHFFYRSQTLSVTSLSSCITMVLSLGAASLRPGTRFAVEGFLAGIFSTIFAAAYPIALSKTHRAFAENATSLRAIFEGDALSNKPTPANGVLLSGDGKDETRAAWKLLHYVNIISMMIVLFFALVSGEIRDISRNCYFLDVAFFWLMMLGAGAAAWATFVTGFLFVRATSPLTMVVAAYPRATLQTLLLMGLRLPTWSWVGVWTCWGSGIWYFVGRRRECGVLFNSLEEEEEEEEEGCGSDEEAAHRRGRSRA